jgi:hypothetical protein
VVLAMIALSIAAFLPGALLDAKTVGAKIWEVLTGTFIFAVSLTLAFLTYKLRRLGWWGTLAMLLVLAFDTHPSIGTLIILSPIAYLVYIRRYFFNPAQTPPANFRPAP